MFMQISVLGLFSLFQTLSIHKNSSKEHNPKQRYPVIGITIHKGSELWHGSLLNVTHDFHVLVGFHAEYFIEIRQQFLTCSRQSKIRRKVVVFRRLSMST